MIEVTGQLSKGIDAADVNVSMKLNDMKPLHAKWIVDLYHEMQSKKEMIVQGFQYLGIRRVRTGRTEILQYSLKTTFL